jgi:tRNA (mo5U34)-methyltransferase
MTPQELLSRTLDWRSRLATLKERNPPDGFTWYGYDITANAWHLAPLLEQAPPALLQGARDLPMADIGTADGDFGLMFSDLGYEVDLIDWPATNWNGMQGVRALTAMLGSRADIHAVDLDSQFVLPRERYGLVLLLGILYHLKNPYYVLEHLAQRCRYLAISTRVARRVKQFDQSIAEAPLAYLLEPDECNNDATNFWIFSAAGLERLVRRCGFRVIASRTVGDTTASNPSDPEHDERMFMLLESTRA